MSRLCRLCQLAFRAGGACRWASPRLQPSRPPAAPRRQRQLFRRRRRARRQLIDPSPARAAGLPPPTPYYVASGPLVFPLGQLTLLNSIRVVGESEMWELFRLSDTAKTARAPNFPARIDQRPALSLSPAEPFVRFRISHRRYCVVLPPRGRCRGCVAWRGRLCHLTLTHGDSAE